ncbi:MAG: hypothetical protein IJH07_03925 [Ruminococcus sp.]|nr:hypothetical protein [Ruminococcus sp.]
MIQCPGCGGALRFDIPTQLMLCDHCGGTYDPASTATMNKDANGRKMFDTYVFTCPSCGGELLTTDQTDAVGFCPFCGGASMLYDRIHRQWEPEYIIPFQITKEQCKELYVKEAKRSVFTSRKYRDPQLIESFRGIYMPYWVYQALQVGEFSLEGEKKGAFTVSSYRVTGNIDVQLDGYGHDASKEFDDRISEHIAPFDPHGHKPFAPGYLSGFYADVGDVNAHQYDKKAIDAMSEDTARLLSQQNAVVRPDGGLRKIRIFPQKAQIPTSVTSAQRTLYPVWFMSYRNKDKITYAAVNGQTGKVSADLPVSPWKILLTVLIVGAAIAASLFFLPSVKANWTLAASALLLVIGSIILHVAFNRVVNEETGLNKTEEAVRFKKRDIWRRILVIVSAVIAFVTAFIDPAYNIISYAGCLLMAAQLFWIMLSHIRFQAEIAKRRPPQFNKKGAAYDEE